CADLARDPGDLGSERAKLLDHRVDRFFELQNFAANIDGDLLGKVAICDGNGDLRDVADLAGQVRCHKVHVVREVFPGAGNPEHGCLPPELAFRSDLARHASDFRSKCRELINHRVDGFFKLQDLAFDVDRDLAAQIAASDGCCHVGDVADLPGEV